MNSSKDENTVLLSPPTPFKVYECTTTFSLLCLVFIMKWLICFFNKVVVFLCTLLINFFIHIFYIRLYFNMRLTVVFPDFVHAKYIMQHSVHISGLVCNWTRICGWTSQVRAFNRSPNFLSMPNLVCVC
jgi:hypothetical protein